MMRSTRPLSGSRHGVGASLMLMLTLAGAMARAQPATNARTEQDLLRDQIVDLGVAGGDVEGVAAKAEAALRSFEKNNGNIGAGPVWHVASPVHDVSGILGSLVVQIRSETHDYQPNSDDPRARLHTRASAAIFNSFVDPGTIVPEIHQEFSLFNDPVTKPGPYSFGVRAYAVTLTFDVPACPAGAATCYPSSIVSVPNGPAPVTLTLLQSGRTPCPISPGQSVRFDRSLGKATITMAEVQGFTFPPLTFNLRLNEGPDIFVDSGLTDEERLATYRKLAKVVAAIRVNSAAIGVNKPASCDLSQELALKTLRTEQRMISAYAIRQKYPDFVRAALLKSATALAQVNPQVLAVHKA